MGHIRIVHERQFLCDVKIWIPVFERELHRKKEIFYEKQILQIA